VKKQIDSGSLAINLGLYGKHETLGVDE